MVLLNCKGPVYPSGKVLLSQYGSGSPGENDWHLAYVYLSRGV